MKTKYSLIPFIPAAIVALALKLMSIFGTDGSGLLFGMNKSTVNYVVIVVTLVLFAVCVVINLTDRKTAPVYAVKKNPVAGFMALLCGFTAAGSSFLTLFNITTDNSDTYLMSIITAALSIPAAVAMILIGKIHFIGKSKVSNFSMFYVLPALWSCTELVSEFLQATKVSISASDMCPLFCYIFITLYLFSSSMIVSRVRGRNPVKACFIYGFPAIAVCIAYGVGTVATATIESMGVQSLVSGAMFIVFALYIMSFTLEMFGGCVTKSEIEIIDSLPDESDNYENSYISSGAYDELIASDGDAPEYEAQNEREDQPRPRTYAEVAAADIDDFIMGYDSDEEYHDRENSGNKVNYDFSRDLVLGTESVSNSEFIKQMNVEPPIGTNEKKPEPRTVLGDEKSQPAAAVEQKSEKRGKPLNSKPKPRKKAPQKPNTENTPVMPKTERVPEAPAAETAAVEERAPIQSQSAAPRREAQQSRRSAEQQPNRRVRSADDRSAQTAQQSGRRSVSAASHARRAAASEETPVRRPRPVRPAQSTRPSTGTVSQPSVDSSVSSAYTGSHGGYDDYTHSRTRTVDSGAASYDNSTVSSERMSDIDRLLKELEDKK